MRGATNGKYPRFAVWENVTGAFSSNGGEDFRCVLEEFCKIKDTDLSVPKPEKWTKAGEIMGENFSVAYRTFDAQYWGVPQIILRIPDTQDLLMLLRQFLQLMEQAETISLLWWNHRLFLQH